MLNIGVESVIDGGLWQGCTKFMKRKKGGDDFGSINTLKRNEEINVLVGW